METARADVDVAEAEVGRLQVRIDFSTIRAPFNGVITKRWVDTGTTVKDASMPLLTLMRTDGSVEFEGQYESIESGAALPFGSYSDGFDLLLANALRIVERFVQREPI